MSRAEMWQKIDEMSDYIRWIASEHRELLISEGMDTRQSMDELDHVIASLEALKDVARKVDAGGLSMEEQSSIHARLTSMNQMLELQSLTGTTSNMN